MFRSSSRGEAMVTPICSGTAEGTGPVRGAPARSSTDRRPGRREHPGRVLLQDRRDLDLPGGHLLGEVVDLGLDVRRDDVVVVLEVEADTLVGEAVLRVLALLELARDRVVHGPEERGADLLLHRGQHVT